MQGNHQEREPLRGGVKINGGKIAVNAKYGHLQKQELDRFILWLESGGWVVDRNTPHRDGAPASLAVARLPDSGLPVLLIRNRKRRNTHGELDILHDTQGLAGQFAEGLEKPNVSVQANPRRRKEKPRRGGGFLAYQPEAMRERYRVPFDIPEGLPLSVECRIYFSEHPKDFPEWAGMAALDTDP